MKASLFLLFQDAVRKDYKRAATYKLTVVNYGTMSVLLYDTLGWEVRMPNLIHGLKGSCLVIPCSFSYTSYPPTNPRRVVWYQYVSRGYPLVYDPLYPDYVIEKFRRKTSLYGNPSNWDCSLLITRLEPSHHGEKLYTWIDPENVGKSTYKFYDVTSTIQVDASPQQPSISVYGGERTGDTITVTCSTFHTCPYSKPTITLNGIEGSAKIKDESIKDGLWKTTLTRTGVVKRESSTIECSVTHYGGITVRATKDKSAECVHHNITIEPELADFTVGVAKNFLCSVYHSCQKEPTITWNYKNMQVTKGRKTLSGLNGVTYSEITFLGANLDHGKKLICTANFSRRKMTTSVVLHVQCVHYNITIEPELADFTEGVAKSFTCSVYHSCQKEPTITWNYENMQVTKGSKTLSGLNRVTYSNINFLGAKEDHGKKLICTADFSGGNIIAAVVLRVQCVHHNITIEPELADFTEGDAVNFTCTIYHSCQNENPKITWNYENMQVTEWNKTLSGLDQISYSSITFLGAKEDHGKKLICTAKFSGRDIEASVVVNVQYPVFIGLKTIGLYILTPSLVFLLACILAVVIIHKKRQRSKDAMFENKPFSKPRMPSPKSDPKSCSGYDYEADYVNMGEFNVYGNI